MGNGSKLGMQWIKSMDFDAVFDDLLLWCLIAAKWICWTSIVWLKLSHVASFIASIYRVVASAIPHTCHQTS